jgi:outer membrane protein assembly factor BamE
MSITPAMARVGLSILAVALAMSTTACGTARKGSSGFLQPYRIDIPQGNYVTQEMLDKVKPGMSRAQVRAALGTPLLNQMFRDDRWDYVFAYLHASGRREQRSVTVFFRDDRVIEIKSDALPARDDSDDPILPGSGVTDQGKAGSK